MIDRLAILRRGDLCSRGCRVFLVELYNLSEKMQCPTSASCRGSQHFPCSRKKIAEGFLPSFLSAWRLSSVSLRLSSSATISPHYAPQTAVQSDSKSDGPKSTRPSPVSVLSPQQATEGIQLTSSKNAPSNLELRLFTGRYSDADLPGK